MAARRLDLLYGFPNFRAVGVFERVGYRVLGRMRRYVKLLNYAPYLRKVQGLALVAPVAGPVLNVAERALDRRHAARGTGPRSFRWLKRFDDRFDRLGEQIAGQAEIVGMRTAAWLENDAAVLAVDDDVVFEGPEALRHRDRGTAAVECDVAAAARVSGGDCAEQRAFGAGDPLIQLSRRDGTLPSSVHGSISLDGSCRAEL